MRTNLISVMLLAVVLVISCQPKQPKEIVANESTTSIEKPTLPEIDWSKLENVEYVQYHNERFGFYVDYPYFMLMDHPPQNGDGFACHCKGLDISGWGKLNSDPVTMKKQNIEEVAKDYAPDEDTVLLQTENAMVVKGKNENGNMYYWKFVNRQHITYCLHIEYASEHSDVLDLIAIHVMESFDCSHPGEEG